jgi:hypothetical protein
MKRLLLFSCLLLGSRALQLQSEALAASPQQPRIIEGLVNPEMISDYYAYSTLFRFISNRFGHERAAIRAYLRQIVSQQCVSCPTDSAQIEKQIDNLIRAGEDFYTRAYPLDLRIKELLEQGPNPAVNAELARLRQHKQAICEGIVASLVVQLGTADAEKVRSHVERMKRKMKIVQ